MSQTHPPYPLDGFCLQWCGSVTYGTTAPVRYYLSTALVLLWSSVLCRHRSRPLPSSPGLHLWSPQRLVTKNWKTEANLAKNSWGQPVPAQLRLARARWRAMDRPAWHLLVDAATSSWHVPETERRERERERERERDFGKRILFSYSHY